MVHLKAGVDTANDQEEDLSFGSVNRRKSVYAIICLSRVERQRSRCIFTRCPIYLELNSEVSTCSTILCCQIVE